MTKVSLSPIGSGDVKITLYMAKPYSEPLRLLKKNDGEFVLILPETYTSAPQKPSISDVIGDVTDADIKLYSFVSNTNQNGYTKIVVKTNGLVNLYPEAVTTGGGTLLNHPQQQINQIISEQINPTPQTPKTQKQENKISQTSVSSQVKPEEIKNKPEQKLNSPITDTAKKEPNKTETAKKQEPVTEIKENEKIIAEFEQNVEKPDTYNIEEIQNLPKITEVEEPVQEIETTVNEETKVSLLTKVKSKLSKIKTFLITRTPNVKDVRNQTGNILLTLISLLLVAFSVKFAYSVLKNSAQKPDNNVKPETDDKTEYSEFFKNLIEAELNGVPKENKKVLSAKRDYTGIEVEPAKSHKEVMNEDQNLSWQEKFRALQKNRKSLFSDENKDFVQKDEFPMENIENMENPIKKLTQDFRAVRKVLEKQIGKNENNESIKQEFTPEKIDKIEIISFEDLQKNIQKPKVQVNKTLPIKKREPKILTRLKLGDNKGFYLVDYKDKISLVGYVNDKVFKLNSYSSVKSPKLYARLTEKVQDTDTYIVKIDNSKLLVDIDEEKMKLKLMY
ncbi:hypothetical protein IJS77_01340 [bacterium]|nr:hypothetical protein [bacterium]